MCTQQVSYGFWRQLLFCKRSWKQNDFMPNMPLTASKLHSVLKLRHERLQNFNLPFFFQANRMFFKSNGGCVYYCSNSFHNTQDLENWAKLITGIFPSLSRGMLGHVSRSTNPVQTKTFDKLQILIFSTNLRCNF